MHIGIDFLAVDLTVLLFDDILDCQLLTRVAHAHHAGHGKGLHLGRDGCAGFDDLRCIQRNDFFPLDIDLSLDLGPVRVGQLSLWQLADDDQACGAPFALDDGVGCQRSYRACFRRRNARFSPSNRGDQAIERRWLFGAGFF